MDEQDSHLTLLWGCARCDSLWQFMADVEQLPLVNSVCAEVKSVSLQQDTWQWTVAHAHFNLCLDSNIQCIIDDHHIKQQYQK